MIELSECIRLESQTLLYEKNVARRVRPDWSLVPTNGRK